MPTDQVRGLAAHGSSPAKAIARSVGGMIRFTAIRLVEIAAMLVLMSFVIYGLIGLMPGDPIDLMLGADPHLTLPSLRDGSLPLPLKGREGLLCARKYSCLSGTARWFP